MIDGQRRATDQTTTTQTAAGILYLFSLGKNVLCSPPLADAPD